MSLFPIFIKLFGRRALVVGAGPVAESKLDGLSAAGARITVVAPVATRGVREKAERGELEWVPRPFEPADLEGAALVVAAVPADVAASVFAEARRRNVLCNSVDDPIHCDFYYPAVVTRGDFQIAISTAGHSPALAQRLRIDLERQFGPDFGEWVRQLGEARRELMASDMEPAERRQQLHAMAAESPRGDERPGGALSGVVYLVGAGPGDPELLTLKALRILGQADVVLHDDLLTPDILELIPPGARIESVGKRHRDPHITQEEINRRLCQYAADGKVVVRLKGGD